jgi:predicted amidophosphoribosyltransferase
VRAGALFGGPVADAVHALKYGGRPDAAGPLGRWLAGRVELPRGARVAWVPLGPGRRTARGYDQAMILAAALAREAGLPLQRGALRRVRETPPQVGRDRAARARNVAGAFAASPSVAGRDVVLVDDVVTTGATAEAAVAALAAAGARSVVVVALARAGQGP